VKKETREVLTLAAAEGTIIGLAVLFRKVVAKPPAPPVGKATLQGTITCSETGLPIPYASVKINTVECSADENGDYAITDIPLGTYILTVSAPGYRTRTLTLDLAEAKVYTQNVALTRLYHIIPMGKTLVEEI